MKAQKRRLKPADVSKLSAIAYFLRGGALGQKALESFHFSDPFAQEVANALTGQKTADKSAKRAAEAMFVWTKRSSVK